MGKLACMFMHTKSNIDPMEVIYVRTRQGQTFYCLIVLLFCCFAYAHTRTHTAHVRSLYLDLEAGSWKLEVGSWI